MTHLPSSKLLVMRHENGHMFTCDHWHFFGFRLTTGLTYPILRQKIAAENTKLTRRRSALFSVSLCSLRLGPIARICGHWPLTLAEDKRLVRRRQIGDLVGGAGEEPV